MNVGYVHTFEVPENNIDKGRLKVSVVNEENVPIKGAAVRLSYTGNPDNIIGESGTDGDGISIFNDLRTPPIEYSMEPGNRQPFSEYDIAVSAPGFDNVNICQLQGAKSQLPPNQQIEEQRQRYQAQAPDLD